MKKYICQTDTYNPFTGCKTNYYNLGSNLLQAYNNWKALKKYDYDYGEASTYRDSYHHTSNMWRYEEAEVIKNDHNFFTPVEDRIHVIPVYGFDGTIIDHVKTTINECLQNAAAMQKNGWIYDRKNDCIETMPLRLTIVDNQFDFVTMDDEDLLI